MIELLEALWLHDLYLMPARTFCARKPRRRQHCATQSAKPFRASWEDENPCFGVETQFAGSLVGPGEPAGSSTSSGSCLDGMSLLQVVNIAVEVWRIPH